MAAQQPPALGDLAAVRAGGKGAVARALTALELRRDAPETIALLDEAWAAPKGVALGFTGPPGVGKSSLVYRMVSEWRKRGKTIAIIAVDPSSHLTGGALLGDRTRMKLDPADQGVFMRSMAARDRLGGLSEIAFPSMVLLRALYDLVLIETVGVGQSEIDIAGVADLTIFCVQPGAGDSLQYMKAGIAEIPDCVVVTKADLKQLAGRAVADVRGALGLATRDGDDIAVLSVSAQAGTGLGELADWLDKESARRAADGSFRARRAAQVHHWIEGSVKESFGREGLKLARPADKSAWDTAPFSVEGDLRKSLCVAMKSG